MVAKCDEFGTKLFALEKEGKEQDECLSKFCCSLTCHIIFRISIRARNFCSSLNCLKDGSRDSKKHLSSSTSVSSIFFCRKISQKKSQEISVRFFFSEYFEAVHFLLLAKCSIPLHHLECLNYFEFRDLQCEVKRNSSWSKYRYLRHFCCPHQMSHSSVNLTPS